MPGGFNLLSRMYTDVQQPLLDAVDGVAGAAPAAPAPAAPANPFASLVNPGEL